ncbi:kinase-like domain-containing protein [Coniella lustricola]|uniref:non-specific serine/threonine protein kinase n=1 Tax=Coniella lustricola TaxID=2025994 RepID=A0A2T3AC07_9PEZI|nr:kinase-like domain-containing protein [Coniella lustricola]
MASHKATLRGKAIRHELLFQEDEEVLLPDLFLRMASPRKRLICVDRLAVLHKEGPAGADLNLLAHRLQVAGELSRDHYKMWEQKIARGAFGIVKYTKPLSFNVNRILGKGGQGMAVLLERQEQDGSQSQVVLKISTSMNGPKVEMDNLRRLAGARHIVQRLFMRQMLPEPPGRPQRVTFPAYADERWHTFPGKPLAPISAKRKAEDSIDPRFHKKAVLALGAEEAAEHWDSNSYAYTMEYMRNGDLLEVMGKMGATGKKFRDQDLWQVFHSLFRGVVAMAYPDTWRFRMDPLKNEIPQFFETIPLNHDEDPWNTDGGMIHFDLDVQNAMVGDFDGLHAGIPIVKIGDLGLATSFTNEDRQDYMFMMRARRRGKAYIYVPEQNSIDWNYLWKAPILENEPVAGNFNWWTNLYQVALIMYSMITLYFPDQPPQASQCQWTVNTRMGPKIIPIWTYGGLLCHEINATSVHSITLREVVAWCMAVDPNNRPTLKLLARILAERCSSDEPEISANQKLSLVELLNNPPAYVPEVADPAS